MSVQQSYREATVQGASPIELVVRLYEQIIEDLRQAAKAFEQNDIPGRTDRIKHAMVVLGHLQSPLDFGNGGKVAQDLDHFYNVLRQNLLQVQFHPSKRGLNQQITDLLAVREAWIKVERAESSSITAAPITTTGRAAPYPATGPASDRVRLDYRG
jgi:flagellar secretion chaperone FliS